MSKDSEEEEVLLQHQHTEYKERKQLPSECKASHVSQWPCSGLEPGLTNPIQVINTNGEGDDGNMCANGNASIRTLDLLTSEYTERCYIPGVCLNACGIDIIDKKIYCYVLLPKQGASEQQIQFGAVSCRVENSDGPVLGEICYFGEFQSTIAATIFVNNARYLFRAGTADGSLDIRGIEYVNYTGFSGSTSPIFNPANNWDQVLNAILPSQTTGFFQLTGEIGDVMFANANISPAGPQWYLIACVGAPPRLAMHALDPEDTTGEVVLNMTFDFPLLTENASAGAQWVFAPNDPFCAWNDGSGVYKIELGSAVVTGNTGTVPMTQVSQSSADIPPPKNLGSDGMNCPTAPFPDFTTRTSTTTSTAHATGDPHLSTFDGRHYLLLRQGSFLLWRFNVAPVDWQLLAHYSGHASYTKGLLLLDSAQAMQVTSKDCQWHKRSSHEWSKWIAEPHIDRDGNSVSLVKLASDVMKATKSGQKRVSYVKLFMNTQLGLQEIAELRVVCRPGRLLNTKVVMYRKGDTEVVEGQLGKHFAQVDQRHNQWGQKMMKMEADQAYFLTKSWTDLGGSEEAAAYLENSDDNTNAMFLQHCTPAEEDAAKKACAKQFETLEPAAADLADCIFDVCRGGEDLAELAAEILKA